MSEMLANQYFMARKYQQAAVELEKSLQHSPKSKVIRSKLIICYTQLNETQKAWNLFVPLVREDFEFIMNMDPIHDDCPCPELVDDIDRKIERHGKTAEQYLNAGMIWLYCDIDNSIAYLEKAFQLDHQIESLGKVINVLRNYVDSPSMTL
ncbi:tetratricopeptide repeat protein [candidate division KSB1 bacterium]|nr:tetratricopeptide repeat protein [candidate division KSB1 bacterium]